MKTKKKSGKTLIKSGKNQGIWRDKESGNPVLGFCAWLMSSPSIPLSHQTCMQSVWFVSVTRLKLSYSKVRISIATWLWVSLRHVLNQLHWEIGTDSRTPNRTANAQRVQHVANSGKCWFFTRLYEFICGCILTCFVNFDNIDYKLTLCSANCNRKTGQIVLFS